MVVYSDGIKDVKVNSKCNEIVPHETARILTEMRSNRKDQKPQSKD